MKSKEKKQNQLSLKMSEAGLDPKKEIATVVIIDILLLVIAIYAFVLTKMPIASLSIILLAAVGDYFLLTKAGRLKNVQVEKLEQEFVHIFSYFKIFIQNGRPVYSALEDCIRYASKDMANLFEELLLSIDKDKSVKPFLTFSEHFKSLEIRQVMISIYKMSTEGFSSQYAQQFESIFASLADEKRKSEIDKYGGRLDSMNFLPMADSALTIGLIIVAIVTIMGRLNYGI